MRDIAAASPPASSLLKMNPLYPGWTRCTTDPARSEARIGSPAEAASCTTTPHGSNLLGKTRQPALLSNSFICLGWTNPSTRTPGLPSNSLFIGPLPQQTRGHGAG